MMENKMLMGVVIGVAAALSIGAVAGYRVYRGPTYAEVLQVSPVHKKVKTSEQVCSDVPIAHKAPVQDKNRVAGMVVGGVLGGVVGNMVGGGRGNTLATVAGVAGGAYAGNKVQKGMQDKDTTTTMEQRCREVEKSHDEVVGYNVRYRLDGNEDIIQMKQPPIGNRLPVKNRKVVLDEISVEDKK